MLGESFAILGRVGIMIKTAPLTFTLKKQRIREGLPQI